MCPFAPETGEDLRRAPRAREDCEAACYDCLMTYTNQRDHSMLDRQSIHGLLMRLTEATVEAAPTLNTRSNHLAQLERLAGSNLEKRWLAFIESHGYRLPSHAQRLFKEAETRPDFFYDGEYGAAIYVDGPHHDYPERRARDAAQEEALEDLGYMVIRFSHHDDWATTIAEYPYVFGDGECATSGSSRNGSPAEPNLLMELFDPEWHPLVEVLATLKGVEIDGGTDVCEGLAPVGASVAEILRDDKSVSLIDGRAPDAEKLVRLIEADGGKAVRGHPGDVEETAGAVERALEG